MKKALLFGVGGAILAAGAAATIAARRWASADDPCKDDQEAALDGKPFTVTTDDGALLDGVVLGAEGGPLIVLSHCWTGDRSTWIPVARRLVAQGHTVVLYDQRGHGASTRGSEAAPVPDGSSPGGSSLVDRAPTPSTAEASFAITRVGADLAAVLDADDARDATVAGHSMGGMAVMALLAEHPETVSARVAATVIASAGGAQVVARPMAVLGRRVLGNQQVDRLLAGPAGPVFIRATVGRKPALGHLQSSRDTFLATAPEVRLNFFAAIGGANLLPGLAAATTPTTVVVGARDLLIPPRRARAVANAIPGAHLVVLPGAGHMLPFETPDELAALIANAGKEN